MRALAADTAPRTAGQQNVTALAVCTVDRRLCAPVTPVGRAGATGSADARGAGDDAGKPFADAFA